MAHILSLQAIPPIDQDPEPGNSGQSYTCTGNSCCSCNCNG